VYEHIDRAPDFSGGRRPDIVHKTIYVCGIAAVNAGGLIPRSVLFADVVPPPPITLIGVTEPVHPQALIEVKTSVTLNSAVLIDLLRRLTC
jgi:hypothetical protein